MILLTAFASVPEAVAAMKDGACDYLVKPVAFEQLEQAAQHILEQARAQSKRSRGAGGACSPAGCTRSPRARQAAASDADILIEAESGTGKELVARLIHRFSPRRDRPFVAVNCSAFPETLLESELFGHAKRRLHRARPWPSRENSSWPIGGTLLLDEVGEMPLGLQPKLLRALQEREFDRLGDTRSVQVDLRVIATTNRALAQMVREGKFRADLYYRLNVIPLALPPLRERREDIGELAEYFVGLYSSLGRSSAADSSISRSARSPCLAGQCARAGQLPAACGGSVHRQPSLASKCWKLRTGARHSRSSCRTRGTTACRPGVSLESVERSLLEMTLAATAATAPGQRRFWV